MEEYSSFGDIIFLVCNFDSISDCGVKNLESRKSSFFDITETKKCFISLRQSVVSKEGINIEKEEWIQSGLLIDSHSRIDGSKVVKQD